MIFKRNKLYKVYSIRSQTPDKEKTLTAAKGGGGGKHIHTLHSQDYIWEKQKMWNGFFPLLFKTTVNVGFYIQQNLFKKKKKNGRLLVSSTVYNKNSTENEMK